MARLSTSPSVGQQSRRGSLKPGTALDDFVDDVPGTPEGVSRYGRALRMRRSGLGSYKESVLAGLTRPRPSLNSGGGGGGRLPSADETLVEGQSTPEHAPREQDTAKLTARSSSKHHRSGRNTPLSFDTIINTTTATTATATAHCHGAHSSAVSDSSQTVTNNNDESVQELVSQGIGALNLDWTWKQSFHPAKPAGVNEEKEKEEEEEEEEEDAPKITALAPVVQRKSARLSLMVKAAGGGVAGKMSFLGKRSRQAVAAGIAAVDGVTKSLQRRSSLRLKAATASAPSERDGDDEEVTNSEKENEEEEEPVRKKAKESSTANIASTVPPAKANKEPTKPAQPARKRWLPHGLYFSDEVDLAPKRKRKRTSKNASRSKPKAENAGNKVLPMPMLAGQHLIEQGRDFNLPFNIFSPLPVREPKPPGWKKLQKNIFVGEAGSLWKSNMPEEMSKCICTPASGCDDGCQNRLMFYECDDGNCNLDSSLCTNRSFEELKQRHKAGGDFNIGVEVIKTTDRGWGVRSDRCFAPGQIIVEYAGEIITQGECDRRMNKIYHKKDCYYLMHFDQNMIIDGTRGSIARFVNHSCEPNCKMEKWVVAGMPRIGLFAGEQGIMVGEELTYDYNFDPFSAKAVQQCRCGTASCRGILGPRRKASPASDSSKAKGAKQKVQEPAAKTGVAAAAATKRRKGASTSSSHTAKSQRPSKQRVTTKTKTTKTGAATTQQQQRQKKARASARLAAKSGAVGFVRLRSVARGVKDRGRSIAQKTAALGKGGKRSTMAGASKPTAASRPRSRKTEPTMVQGVARSVRARKPVSLPSSVGLFENNSTIRLI